MRSLPEQFGVVIVGGGPAACAVLLSAHKDGRLDEFLEHGVLIVERRWEIGSGEIGNYAIRSDSTGFTFVDPLRVGSEQRIHSLQNSEVAQRIAAAGPEAVPLRDVGELMRLIGRELGNIINRSRCSTVLTGCTVESARRLPDQRWALRLWHEDGSVSTVRARHVVLATGATQPVDKLGQDVVAGEPVVARWGHKLMQSGEVLQPRGLAEVAERLRGCEEPKVAILGGSTSAMATAHALLHRAPDVRFRDGGVALFHRRPMRVYYTSVEEAIADGYTDFTPADICPVTKRVYRLAGLRLDSRELLMQVLGVGGRDPEPRLTLYPLQGNDSEARARIDAADLVIAALGYRPNALPLFDSSGTRLPLHCETGPNAPLVDGQCRVLDSHARALKGVFGIGLAAGFVPHGPLGGEPSFSGQANGLWLWQNGIGSIIVDAILSAERGVRAGLSAGTSPSFGAASREAIVGAV